MAVKIYLDAACTQEFSGVWQLIHKTDLSDNPQGDVLYWAEVEDDPGDNGVYRFEASSNPGVDNIVISITDSAVGSGHEASEITLATSAAALDTNTAGASLSLGTSFLSGVSNAQEIHIRVVNAVTTVSNSTELALAHNQLLKTATT